VERGESVECKNVNGPECRGKGQLRANIYHLMKSIDCTEAYFKRYLLALVVDFERHCYEDMSGAERVIKQSLNFCSVIAMPLSSLPSSYRAPYQPSLYRKNLVLLESSSEFPQKEKFDRTFSAAFCE